MKIHPMKWLIRGPAYALISPLLLFGVVCHWIQILVCWSLNDSTLAKTKRQIEQYEAIHHDL